MKWITKVWSRILISYIMSAMCGELYVITTGDTTYPDKPGALLGPFIIIFLLFTAFVLFQQYKYYFFPNRLSDDDTNEDILDDI